MKTQMMKTSSAAAMALVTSAGFVYGNPPIGFYEGPGEVVLEKTGVLTVLVGEVGATRVGIEFDVTALMTADSLHGEQGRIAHIGWLTIAPGADGRVDLFVDPIEPEAPEDWVPPDWALDGPDDVTRSFSWQQYVGGLNADRAAWLAARTPFQASLIVQSQEDRERSRTARDELVLNLHELLASANQRVQIVPGGPGGGMVNSETAPSAAAADTVKDCPGGYCKCTVGDMVGQACCPKGFMPICNCNGPIGGHPATAEGKCIKVERQMVGDGSLP